MESKFIQLPDVAMQEMRSVLDMPRPHKQKIVTAHESLFAAMQAIADAMAFTLKAPDLVQAPDDMEQQLQQIMDTNHLRKRTVQLTGRWWQSDHGPLLVFSKEQQRPMALLPAGNSRYVLLNPEEDTRQLVDQTLADALMDQAIMLYPSFPETKKKLTLMQLFKFTLRGHYRLIRRIISMQLLINIFALFIPIATGWIMDLVIPNTDVHLLWEIVIVLLMNAFVMSLFQITQAFALIRITFKLNVKAQSAIWDRLLRLPVDFFRRYTAGDLTNRAYGIDNIQQLLTGGFITTIVSGVLSVVIFALLFYYNIWLGLVAFGLALIYLLVHFLGALIRLRYERRLFRVQGALTGFVFQLMQAISKFRVAGCESYAFARWMKRFSKQNRLNYISDKISVHLQVFTAGMLVINTLLIFIVVNLLGERISFGHFIAFNAAYMQLFAAFSSLVNTANNLIQVVPLYERMQPILQELPEDARGDGLVKDVLQGDLQVEQVSYRYQADYAPVLSNVSLQVKAGKLTAIVGPSGAGKSSLVKLLLGFALPEQGQILYDGQDLSAYDIRAVRRQIGVVLQDTHLMPGTILDNLIGSSHLSEADAWRAVKLACMDEDIQKMPMGMQTPITEAGKTLSAGQRQRLLIARALIKQPSILILDEATSALDNATQSRVMKALENSAITRLVISQRYQTIVHAHYVYVMQNGSIAQSGTVDELKDYFEQ